MAAEEGAVIACHTKHEFDDHMARGKEAGKLVIIDFTASWCGPCRVIAPVFAEYAKKFPGAIFLKVDVDELKEVAEAYNVEAMPTFMFIKDGEKVDTVVGGKKDDIHNKIVALMDPASASTDRGRRMAAEEGAVIACHTKHEFDDHMARGKEAGKLVIIDFTASWCGPCRVIAPIFAEYAKKFPGAIFLKVDVDELKDVAEAYNVEAMPTFMFIKDGEKVDTVVGGNKDDIHNKIVALMGPASAST